VTLQLKSGLDRLMFDVPRFFRDTYTPCRTTLNETSARRRNLHLHSTQQTQGTNNHVLRGIRTIDPSNQVALGPQLHPDMT